MLRAIVFTLCLVVALGIFFRQFILPDAYIPQENNIITR